MPDRPLSRMCLVVTLTLLCVSAFMPGCFPLLRLLHPRRLVLPISKSCLFLQVSLAITSFLLVTLVAIDRKVVACFCHETRAALSFSTSQPHTLPHLRSMLAGRQVVEHCGGTRTLVPHTRCEHVVNMGHCGHARVSDLVAQTSQGPLSLLLAPALLQSAYSLSPYFALYCEECSAPCARN
jgi:hypothetical protein